MNRSTGVSIILMLIVSSISAYGNLFSWLSPKKKKETEQSDVIDSSTLPTFASVAGLQGPKEDLGDIIRWLKNPRQFETMGARPPKGVLLVGPPGNGKTLLARALAGEAGCSFLYTSGSEFVERWVGVGAARIRTLFEQAVLKAPCIIFIDEIDAVGKRRSGNSSGGGEYDQTLNQLLTEMDGFVSNQNVFVVGATNRVDILDPALVRPGRFDKIVHINNPDWRARKEILKFHALSICVADDVDLNSIAYATQGLSGAQLANVVNQAALYAIRENKEIVTATDFEEALDTLLLGSFSSVELSAKEKKITAFHEAGHALITLLLPNTADPLHKVTIEPRGAALGVSFSRPTSAHYITSKKELESRIMVCMGGRAAEELIFNAKMSSAASDFQQAMHLARMMVCQYGMHPDVGLLVINPYGDRAHISEETRQKIDRAVVSVLNSCYTRAKQLLQDNRGKLVLLADTLLEKTTLTAKQVHSLLSV